MLVALDPIRQVTQRLRQTAHGGDRLPSNIRNHRIIHVRNRMTQFHFNQFHRFLDAAADATWAGTLT